MGAQPSSPKGHGALGGVGGIQSSLNTKQAAPFAAADSEREARPPRRCLPLAWSADEMDQPQLSPGNAFREATKEAWEPRPVSRSSTASTSTGNNSYSFHRPGSASSGTTLPSMSSSASLGYHSYRSSSSCSRPSPGGTPLAREHRRERRSKSKATFEKPPEPAVPAAQQVEQETGTEIRLEDARQRAAKSMEDLMLKLKASRSSGNSGAASGSGSNPPGQRSQASSSSSSAALAQTFAPSRRLSFSGHEASAQSRQAWAEPKQRGSDHLELRIDSHTNRGGSAEQGPRAAGNAGASMPSVPSSGPSPSRMPKAAHQARTMMPSQSMVGPVANVLGHRYLDPSDGV
eukprot:TRINITY_DN12523_c0_g1_i2.p1 TRINITY_DN12523_c0_g1~~TRINITY_DN12523_c0_g1_i2.p1  ORF type:complete len:346 (-),score=54.89 TRINITY_DN12523_c0_g1_i2:57-1094(-)